MFSARQEISVLYVMQTTTVFIGLSVCCWFSVLLSNVSKGALSYATQYYKGTSFSPFFGSSSDLYTGTHERNYKNVSINLRERALFLYVDV